MNSTCGIAHIVQQIDLGGLPEVILRQRNIAETRCDEGVYRRA
jgi:hypothetical protein